MRLDADFRLHFLTCRGEAVQSEPDIESENLFELKHENS